MSNKTKRRKTTVLKSLIRHNNWFYRNSQLYVYGDWYYYAKQTLTVKEIISYCFGYPKALVIFLWLSRTDISNGKGI